MSLQNYLRKGKRVDLLFPRKSFSSYLKPWVPVLSRITLSRNVDVLVEEGRLGRGAREQTRAKPSWDFWNQTWSKSSLRWTTLEIIPYIGLNAYLGDYLPYPLCSLVLNKKSFYAEEHGTEAEINSLPDFTSLDSKLQPWQSGSTGDVDPEATGKRSAHTHVKRHSK